MPLLDLSRLKTLADRPMMMSTGIRLPRRLYLQLDEIAKATKCSRNRVLVKLLEFALEELRKKDAPKTGGQ